MPTDKVTPSNDIVKSITEFRVQCKECGQNYILEVKIKPLELKKT